MKADDLGRGSCRGLTGVTEGQGPEESWDGYRKGCVVGGRRKKAESLDIVWSKAVLQCGEQGALEQARKRQGRFPTKAG